jgi:hypothetical protein
MLRRRRLVALFMLHALACGAPAAEPVEKPEPLPEVRNPSGDCETPADNGAGDAYGSGSEARYLPDCKAPLRRQYYRVFAQSESRAWLMPRPDHGAPTRALCASEAAGSPLRTLFDKYTLCDEAPNVDRVNAMTPSDALAIAHALHERLRFVAFGGEAQPFAYADDVLAVCDAKPELAKGVLSDRCARQRKRQRDMQTGAVALGPYVIPPDHEGPPLAAALNELYGIAPQ